MTLKISLDRAALEALFPEGSDARVNLQRAVVADLVSKLAIKDVKYLSGEVVRLANEAAAKESRAMLSKHFGANHMFLSDQVEATVKRTMELELSSEIRRGIMALRADLLTKIRDKAEEFSLDEEAARVIVGKLVREELKNMVGGR